MPANPSTKTRQSLDSLWPEVERLIALGVPIAAIARKIGYSREAIYQKKKKAEGSLHEHPG